MQIGYKREEKKMDMKFDPVTGERIQEDGAAQQEQPQQNSNGVLAER